MSIYFFSKCLKGPAWAPPPRDTHAHHNPLLWRWLRNVGSPMSSTFAGKQRPARGFESWVTFRTLLEVSSASAVSQPLCTVGTAD